MEGVPAGAGGHKNGTNVAHLQYTLAYSVNITHRDGG